MVSLHPSIYIKKNMFLVSMVDAIHCFHFNIVNLKVVTFTAWHIFILI
jgi:hypothetical protein